MTEDNFSKDEHKDFARVASKYTYQQIASHSKETVSQFSIKVLILLRSLLSITSRDKNIKTRAFNRCRKMFRLVGSCNGTLILHHLDGSAYRHLFPTEPSL